MARSEDLINISKSRKLAKKKYRETGRFLKNVARYRNVNTQIKISIY